MTEVTTRSEDQQKVEVLNPDFSSFHARMVLACSIPDEIPNIIDPSKEITPDMYSKKKQADLNFDAVTNPLSISERRKAWEGVEYNEAMVKWKSRVKEMYSGELSDEEVQVYKHFFGNDKNPGELTDDDVQNFYDSYIGANTSTISEFIRHAAKSPELDKNSLKKLLITSFGRKSGEAGILLYEIEMAANNNPELLDNIFLVNGDLNLDILNRTVSNPDSGESKLLKDLHDHYVAPKRKPFVYTPKPAESTPQTTPKPTEAGGAPLTEQPAQNETKKLRDDWKIRVWMVLTDDDGEKYYINSDAEFSLTQKLTQAISSVENDEILSDTSIAEELEGKNKDESLVYLRERLADAKKEEADEISKKGQARINDDRIIKIVRMEDNVEVDELSIGELRSIEQSEDSRYKRDHIERKLATIEGDGQKYILQTFYDKNNGKEYVRFYTDPRSGTHQDVKKLQLERSQFDAKYANRQIVLVDEPTPTISDAEPQTLIDPTPEPEADDEDITPAPTRAGQSQPITATPEPEAGTSLTDREKERTRLLAILNAGGTREEIDAAKKALEDFDAEADSGASSESEPSAQEPNPEPPAPPENITSPKPTQPEELKQSLPQTSTSTEESTKPTTTTPEPTAVGQDTDLVKNPVVDWEQALTIARREKFNENLFKENSRISKIAKGLKDGSVKPESINKKDYISLSNLQKQAFLHL